MASPPSLPCSAIARYEYKSAEDGELSLKKNEQVVVEQINESGWCLATSGDRTGWVPATYLEIGKTSASKPPTKQAPKAPLTVSVESSGTKQPAPATTATKATSKPAATPKPSSSTPTTTPAPKSSTTLASPPSTTTRTSTSKASPAAKSPPPKAEPAKTPVTKKSTKPIRAAATFDDDDMPPPPPSSPPPGEMPPPPDGPLPDELRGDDADTTPESSDADEEKPQKKLPRRKKLQDIMQNEKEAAANEIFKMFDDREDDFDVGVNGEFDQDKWISEMLDTEDDPPPPPEHDEEEVTPVKSAPPRSEPETKKARAQSKRTPVKARSETIAERERARTELQTAISLDKKKKVEKGVTNLDLSYVTDRIIAMGCPSESGASKNNINNYKKFFKQYHDNHLRIYNLEAGKTYAPEKMKPFPVNSSFQFEAGNVPAFHTTLDVCKSISDWLSSDDLNVAVLHCNEGARTGLITCCYLLFSAVCNSAPQALRYYAAFRGKEAMSGMSPSQVRYLNYFETYSILVKKQTDSGGLSQFLPGGTEEEPTTPVKPGSVRETRSHSTKGPPLLRKGVLEFILPEQHVTLKDVTLVPVPARFATDSVWFRLTHTEFTYESKGNLRGTKNTKQGKLQIVVKDKSDKGAPPLMHGDLKFELFNAKGLRNEKIYQCWFNTRFLEDANMDETVEASLEEIKRLESKSIQKWDASDKQLYQEAMENVRKFRKKEIVTSDDTPPTPTVGGDLKDKHMPAVWDEVEIEGRDYDVLQLHLDKKKLDGLCTDSTKNKITAGEFSMTLTFHRPKQRETPPARSLSPPPTKGHR